MAKIRVGVICGGRSAEHEVSLQSAQNIISALDRTLFDLTVIGVDRQGLWHLFDEQDFLRHADTPDRIALGTPRCEVALVAGARGPRLIDSSRGTTLDTPDVVFPIIHGSLGEDGALQGLLRMADIACVGSSVLASAACMDKDVTKRLLRDAGLAVAPFRVLDAGSAADADFDTLSTELGCPLFVKPANQGSSVGVSRVAAAADLGPALARALTYDHKVLVETAIVGREIECSVTAFIPMRPSTSTIAPGSPCRPT